LTHLVFIIYSTASTRTVHVLKIAKYSIIVCAKNWTNVSSVYYRG